MTKEMRRARRQPLRRYAWVVLESRKLQQCSLFDISDSGARIQLDDTRSIPDRFILFLSRNGVARRACQVVWRNDRQLGVRIKRQQTDFRAKRAAKPDREPALVGSESENA